MADDAARGSVGQRSPVSAMTGRAVARSLPPEWLQDVQHRLFEASGIIESVRTALSNNLDEDAADNALRAASRLIDSAASSLERRP